MYRVMAIAIILGRTLVRQTTLVVHVPAATACLRLCLCGTLPQFGLRVVTQQRVLLAQTMFVKHACQCRFPLHPTPSGTAPTALLVLQELVHDGAVQACMGQQRGGEGGGLQRLVCACVLLGSNGSPHYV